METNEVAGMITDCETLCVYEEPSFLSKIIDTAPVGTDLVIDLESSEDRFYKVYNVAGIEGYCLKRYVTIMPPVQQGG